MYSNRKILVLYLVIFSVIISIIFPNAMKTSANSNFKDVPVSFWAYDAIDYLTSLDVITGYKEQDGTSTFKPDNQVTRTQAAIMIVKALNPNDKGKLAGKASFPDVPLDHWASAFIERAYELGVFKGRENGKFSPQDPITRAQMSAVIANVFSLDPNIVVAHSFNDVSSSHWAYESISLLYSNGIVQGNSQGYEPEKVTNRAQFSVILTNTLHASKITEAAIEKGTVSVSSLNVRELPSTTAKIVTKLQNNQIVDIYGKLNNWYIINHNDKRAYVSANYITNVQVIGEEGKDEEKVKEEVKEEPTPIVEPISPPEADLIIGKGFVTATSLNVRESPSNTSKIVGSLLNGKEVNIYSVHGDWAKIRYENHYRYVHKGFLSLSMLGKDQLAGRTIVLDPGHGGKDPGASGFGIVEKEIVLDVGLRLQKLLKAAGVNVVMTRDKDVYLTLDERVEIAKNIKAESFISIHANAFSDERANGTETFWNSYFTSEQSEALAKEIQEELLFLLNTYDRGLKQANFRVIRQTPMPSVLVELAFVTNQSDAEDMAKVEFRDKAAQAIYQGIVNYYNKSN